MQITFDPNNLTDVDIAVLQAVLGQPAAPKAEKAESSPKKATTAKATPKAEKAVEEPEEASDEPVDADADDEPETGNGATMEDAVALATKLVSSGQAAKVKAALAEAGAKRVSELKDEDIPGFIATLS